MDFAKITAALRTAPDVISAGEIRAEIVEQDTTEAILIVEDSETSEGGEENE